MRGKNKKNEKVNKVEKAVKKVTDPIEKVGKEFKIEFDEGMILVIYEKKNVYK